MLGPLTNWFFLRHVGGGQENEADQEERYEAEDPGQARRVAAVQAREDAFWPGLAELANGWTWAVVGLGAAGVVLRRSSEGRSKYRSVLNGIINVQMQWAVGAES